MGELLTCGRCQTQMFRSTRREHERIGDWELITKFIFYECGFCGMTHMTKIPGLEPQQLENDGA